MCGIFGSINVKQDKIEEVRDLLLHRGPDAQKINSYDNVFLGQNRLSIQDIEFGHQPLEIGNYVIVFNGEIYNHAFLKEKYQLKCKTNSDTEVLLHLYINYGGNILSEIDGMFAFCIYNKKKHTMFFARDRAGKKPIYFYFKDNTFVFSSETKSLAATFGLEPDYNSLGYYFRLGYFMESRTAFQNVFELNSGSYMTLDCESLSYSIKKWWNIEDYYLKDKVHDEKTAVEALDRLLVKSVVDRLVSSDLEVGSFLSGGIDSGLITAIASKHVDKLKTFTVSFPGAYNEAPLAKMVAEKYGTDHTELNINFNNLRNDIENIILNYGEPFFDSSAIPSYYVSKEAKKHLTVVLNGDGADELFGGYRRYVPFSKTDFFNQGYLIKAFAKIIKKVIPIANEKKSTLNYVNRLTNLASKSKESMYLTSTTDVFEDFESNLIFNSIDPKLSTMLETINNSTFSGLEKLMLVDFKTILFGDLLVKMDIATMANSLEGRSPFLSKYILEYAPSLSDKLKISGITTKYILRKLSERYLPSDLLNQPKRGFEIPLKKWVNNDLKEPIFDCLNSGAFIENFIDKNFLEALKANKVRISDEKRSKILWALYSVQIWNRNLKK